MKSLTHRILDDRCAFVGTAGSGKTVAAKGMVEDLLDTGARVGIVDPLGVWYGLTSDATGTKPGYKLVIFGGKHADIPVTDTAGAAVGAMVAKGAFSWIVDISELPSQSKRRRFMKDFAEVLYASNRESLHLVLDEADMWCPQKPMEDIAAVLGSRIDEIVRRGRVRGFIPWLITQRPAVIHKDVLSQLDSLIAMKLTSSQDRNALDAWIEGQADKAEQKRIYGLLPSLPVGKAIVWSPGQAILQEHQFRMIKTFDSSRTPKRGEKVKQATKRAEVDIDAMRAELATVTAEAQANDPKVLKARIADIEKQLKKAPAVAPGGPTPADVEAMRRKSWEEGCQHGRVDTGKRMRVEAGTLLKTVAGAMGNLEQALAGMDAWLGRVDDAITKAGVAQPVERRPSKSEAAGSTPVARSIPPVITPATATGRKISKAERAVLTALAQYPQGRTKNQVAILTGYAVNGGGFNNAISACRTAGLLDGSGDRLVITGQGLGDLGEFTPLPMGRDLLQHWLGQLSKAERAVLEVLANSWPHAMTKPELAAHAGYEPNGGGFNNALSRLRTLELISGRGELKASDDLMGEG